MAGSLRSRTNGGRAAAPEVPKYRPRAGSVSFELGQVGWRRPVGKSLGKFGLLHLSRHDEMDDLPVRDAEGLEQAADHVTRASETIDRGVGPDRGDGRGHGRRDGIERETAPGRGRGNRAGRRARRDRDGRARDRSAGREHAGPDAGRPDRGIGPVDESRQGTPCQSELNGRPNRCRGRATSTLACSLPFLHPAGHGVGDGTDPDRVAKRACRGLRLHPGPWCMHGGFSMRFRTGQRPLATARESPGLSWETARHARQDNPCGPIAVKAAAPC